METNGKLYTDVMAKLQFEPGLDASNLTVAIKTINGIDNIVVLGGTVTTYAEKHLSEEAVEKIGGVRGVANEIEVDLTAQYKRSDVDIAQVALNALKWTVLVPYEQLKVAVSKGFLTLSGEVEHFYQKKRAYDAVKNLPGVKAVFNKITVAINVKPTDVKDKILKEFERNARVDANNIQVKVEGSKVILSGKVRNLDEYTEAKEAAFAIPGITEVIMDALHVR